jgi:hypothetical protein
MRDDAGRLGESAHVRAAVGVHDEVTWHCHTRLEKLWIPSGLRRATLDELDELARLRGAFGIERVEEGGALRTVGELQRRLLLGAGAAPEVVEVDGNLLVYGGASCQWQTLIGNGTSTAGQTLTFFSNARAAIGVGDSSTAAVNTQTDLQAATNKLRVAMDGSFPSHTDGTTSGAASIVFQSTFGTSDANFAWAEWGIFNSSSAGTGRMLNRKVESLGTKTSASTWTLTLTLSLS